MGNKGLLTIVIVLLMGIFAVMVIQLTKETPEEQVAGSISNAVDNISDQMTENMR